LLRLKEDKTKMKRLRGELVTRNVVDQFVKPCCGCSEREHEQTACSSKKNLICGFQQGQQADIPSKAGRIQD